MPKQKRRRPGARKRAALRRALQRTAAVAHSGGGQIPASSDELRLTWEGSLDDSHQFGGVDSSEESGDEHVGPTPISVLSECGEEWEDNEESSEGGDKASRMSGLSRCGDESEDSEESGEESASPLGVSILEHQDGEDSEQSGEENVRVSPMSCSSDGTESAEDSEESDDEDALGDNEESDEDDGRAMELPGLHEGGEGFDKPRNDVLNTQLASGSTEKDADRGNPTEENASASDGFNMFESGEGTDVADAVEWASIDGETSSQMSELNKSMSELQESTSEFLSAPTQSPKSLINEEIQYFQKVTTQPEQVDSTTQKVDWLFIFSITVSTLSKTIPPPRSLQSKKQHLLHQTITTILHRPTTPNPSAKNPKSGAMSTSLPEK